MKKYKDLHWCFKKSYTYKKDKIKFLAEKLQGKKKKLEQIEDNTTKVASCRSEVCIEKKLFHRDKEMALAFSDRIIQIYLVFMAR